MLLHRGRGPRALPEIELRPRGRSLEIALPKGWLDQHPLTAADLEQETEYLRVAGFRLRAG